MQEPLFEINKSGRYTHVNKSVFTRPYLNPVTLFTEHREMSSLGVNISCNFSLIEGSLYLTFDQLCELFETDDKLIRNHLNNIFGFWLHSNFEENKGGGQNVPPLSLTILDIPVTFDPRAAVGGGGGTQNVPFYHHDVIIDLASRMTNTRARVINQFVKDVIHEYNKNLHVVNPAIHDINNQQHLTNLQSKAFNFSPQRWDMVEANKYIDKLFYMCGGIYDHNGDVVIWVWQYFRRCIHNTAHVSAVGLTALQLRATRANPYSVTFGQQNFRGKNAPYDCELKNACNLLTNEELITRTCVLNGAISRIITDIQKSGSVHFSIALRMFTMYSVSPYIPYASWNYCDYPETALDNVINMPDISNLRVEVRKAINTYKTNFPNRYTLSKQESDELFIAEQFLVDAIIANVSDGE